MLACGTSFYAALTSKYWLEAIAGIPVDVEIASEYRYRTTIPDPETLVVTISQSGETADTLAALKHAVSMGMTKRYAMWRKARWSMSVNWHTSHERAWKSEWQAPRRLPRNWWRFIF
jgi:glucosamine--fructose-6-phosphate aminotransferase (isomerizing)